MLYNLFPVDIPPDLNASFSWADWTSNSVPYPSSRWFGIELLSGIPPRVEPKVDQDLHLPDEILQPTTGMIR